MAIMSRSTIRVDQGGPASEPPDGTTPPAPASLRGRALGGAFWSMVGFGGGQVIRLASNLILTRLLFAEAFGLNALCSVLIQGLQLFSDIGLGPSVIQNRRGDDPRFLHTAFTMQVVRGLLLFLVACALTVPFARFYGDPRLLAMVPLIAFTTVMQGFQSIRLFTANRELAVGRINLIELLSQIAGTAVMVAWALVHRSVWALVAGALATNLAKTALSHLMLPGPRDRLRWNRADAHEIFRFGRWIFLSTVFTFLAGQSDRLIFGKLVPLGLLGVYGIALMIAMLPSQALYQLTSSIYFPLYSRVVARGEDLAAEMRRTRAPVIVLGGWAACGLVAGGPTAVRLIFDARYQEAGWMVQWLALGLWFLLLENLNGVALLARGLAHWTTAGSLAKFLAMTAMIPLGFKLGGFPGAVAAVAMSEIVRYLVSTLGTERQKLRAWPRDLLVTAVLLLVAAAVRLAVIRLQGRWPVALEAALVAVLVTAAWLPLGWPHAQALLRRRRQRTG
jgi:O-antigen/teichoic acid export membrane protein